jgi:TetR/AcrR family transcriptional regulator, transcriptional repressor for nem operon
MRYPKEHKAQAKATIVREAARTLKENGFHSVGVDRLAASAQVTSGALYSNFANKEAVLEAVVATQLGLEFAGLADQEPAERRRLLAEILRLYLSNQHRKDAGHGCVMPSLSADVARAGGSVRKAYRRRIVDVIALLAPAMHGTPEQQTQQAWTLLASIVGAVTIARALPTGEQAQAVLDAVFASALQSITEEPKPGLGGDRAPAANDRRPRSGATDVPKGRPRCGHNASGLVSCSPPIDSCDHS